MKYKNFFNSIFSLVALFILIYLAFSFYSIGDRPWIFYNSDNGIPYLYQDLMERGGQITQWKFAAVNNFFPDAFLFFIIQSLIHNIRLSILLLGVVQISLFYGLIEAIAKLVCKDLTNVALFRLSALFAIMLLAAGSFLHKEIMEAALVCWLHFGTTLMCLMGLWLVLRTYSFQTKLNGVMLFLICFLTTFSDLLFITQFTVTMTGALVLAFFISDKAYAKLHIKNGIIILSGTLLAYIVYKLNAFGWVQIAHEHEILRRVRISDLLSALHKLQAVLKSFYSQNVVTVFLFSTYFVISFLYLLKLFYRRITRSQLFADSNFNLKFIFTHLFLVVSILVGLLTFMLLDNDLMVDKYFGMRHYQPIILFPVFIGIPLWLMWASNLGQVVSKYFLWIILSILLTAYVFGERGSIKNVLNFYPPSVACLDQVVNKYHLENGAANYWEAKSYRSLSRTPVNIVAVNSELKPHYAINTMNDYNNKQFNFLIIQDKNSWSPSYPSGAYPELYLTENQIRKSVGPFAQVVNCPSPVGKGRDIIYIFEQGVLNKRFGTQ